MEQTRQQGIKRLLELADLPNIYDELKDDELIKLGRDVVWFTSIDDESREEWLKKSGEAMDLALQVVEKKTSPWDGASNVKYPLITVAALQFHARCYPAIVSGDKVVKGRVTGEDPGGEKQSQAYRVASHMNWQLLEENEDWEEEVDKLLLALPVEGTEFKKSYFAKEKGHNISEWVRPKDFIVNDKTKSLGTCPRMTHRLFYYPYEIDERMRNGVWANVNLDIEEDALDEEVLQEFYEQHTYLDIDEDGYKEPYIVTVHKESEKVVRVVAGFYPEDIVLEIDGVVDTLKNMTGAVPKDVLAQKMETAKLVKVPRVQMFTKYGFIPSPDGSFYDIGFGQLCGPLSNSVDTNINQLIDAGTLANMQAGFMQDGVSIDSKRGDIKFKRGEFKRVKLPANVTMNNAIYQIKFPEPSTVLFQLLGMLIQSVKDITSIQDIMTGANQQVGQAATTSMIQVEQGMKVFSSIYKRIYRSLKQEFKKLYKLNGRYLRPEQYFMVLDTQRPEVIYLKDYRGDGTDVQPVADPQLATNTLAMAKNQALLGVMNHPSVNDDEVLVRYFNALDVPSPERLLIPRENRQQPPDPELVLKAQIAASEHSKRIAEIAKLYAEALDKVASAEARELGPQMDMYLETLKAAVQGMSNGQMAQTAGNAGGGQGTGTVLQGSGSGLPGLPGPGAPGPSQGIG